MESGMSLLTTSFKSDVATSRWMMSNIFLRIWRILNKRKIIIDTIALKLELNSFLKKFLFQRTLKICDTSATSFIFYSLKARNIFNKRGEPDGL